MSTVRRKPPPETKGLLTRKASRQGRNEPSPALKCRDLEFVHLGNGRSIIFQSDEAPKARFIPAWGSAPGIDSRKIIKGCKPAP